MKLDANHLPDPARGPFLARDDQVERRLVSGERRTILRVREHSDSVSERRIEVRKRENNPVAIGTDYDEVRSQRLSAKGIAAGGMHQREQIGEQDASVSPRDLMRGNGGIDAVQLGEFGGRHTMIAAIKPT